jgi:MinD-like ATPase involved in chromosome partitioning or flagellar assembly
MIESIVIVIFFGGLLGIVVILIRKIPVLVSLPVRKKKTKESSFPKIKEKIIALNPLKYIPSEIFLQKVLSKVRVLTIKLENKTAIWLKQLREKAKRKKEIENDKYWEDLGDSTNQENDNNSFLPG